MIKKKICFLLSIIMICLCFSGCGSIDKLQLKLGMKNNDFEYIKDGKIGKVVIQNTRDKGFKYVITDKKAILELYDILSTGKKVAEKTALTPDYTLEFYEGESKVYKFNYVAGLDKKDAGNLYSTDKVYLISGRLDSDIIQSFTISRIPKDFKNIYYEAILQVLDTYKNTLKKDISIGVNIKDDVEIQRFLLSTEIEDFKGELKSKNASIISDNEKYDAVASVVTSGYRTSTKETNYKCIITINNTKDNSKKIYYVKGIYNSFNRWEIKISTDKMPS